MASIVLSKDGNLWISVAKDVQGLGAAMNYMLKLSLIRSKWNVFISRKVLNIYQIHGILDG